MSYPQPKFKVGDYIIISWDKDYRIRYITKIGPYYYHTKLIKSNCKGSDDKLLFHYQNNYKLLSKLEKLKYL